MSVPQTVKGFGKFKFRNFAMRDVPPPLPG